MSVQMTADLKSDILALHDYFTRLLNIWERGFAPKEMELCLPKIKKIMKKLSIYDEEKNSFADLITKRDEADLKFMITFIKSQSKSFTGTSQSVLLELCKSSFFANKFTSFPNNLFYMRNQNEETFTCLPEEIVRYLKIGHALKDENSTKKLKKELCLFASREHCYLSDDFCHVPLIGPSLMGKTQTAFTLCHLMNVIYLNFGRRTNEFRGISELFLMALEEDIKIKIEYGLNASGCSPFGLKTVGLLYCLIWRRHIYSSNETLEQYLLFLMNVKSVFVPEMKYSQFRDGLDNLNIDLNENLVFIDDFCDNGDQHELDKIKFLRDMCRELGLNCVTSGSDSMVSFPYKEPNGDGCSSENYCIFRMAKVVTKGIQPTIKSLCCTIEFDDYEGKNAVMGDYISNGGEGFNYEGFTLAIYGPEHETIAGLNTAMKVLEIIFKHSKTGLAGWYFEALKSFVSLLINAKNDINLIDGLLGNLVNALCNRLKELEASLTEPEGILTSAQILSFLCTEKKQLEKDETGARKVRNYFFRLGDYEDGGTFDLTNSRVHKNATNFDDAIRNSGFDIDDEGRRSYWRGGPSTNHYKYTKDFEHSCHFSQVYDDFLLPYCMWNLWYTKKLKDVYSLANLYKNELEEIKKDRCNQKDSESFSLELLSLWSIAYASHCDFEGNASGLQALDEFIKNLQVFEDGYSKSFEEYRVPEGLGLFLIDVNVPYLVCGAPLPDSVVISEADESDFINAEEAKKAKRIRTDVLDSPDDEERFNELIVEYAPIISIGTCYRPVNNSRWDLLFDLKYKGIKGLGYIECELWSKAANLPLMFPYYKKACLNGFKVSILVCNHIQVTIEEEANLKLKKSKTEYTDVNSEMQQDKYQEMLNELWNSSDQGLISIYAVSYRSKLDHATKAQVGLFEFEALKEFDNPAGVFILLESNFDK